jgi:hypothetical protein
LVTHTHRERGGSWYASHDPFMYPRVEARYVSWIYDTAQHLMATTWAENKKKEWEGEKNRNPNRNCHSVSISCIIQAPRLYSDMSNTDKFVLGIYVRMYIDSLSCIERSRVDPTALFVIGECFLFILQSPYYTSFTLFFFFRSSISLTLSCPMNLKLYPLDRQTCTLSMISCEYIATTLSILLGSYTLDAL